MGIAVDCMSGSCLISFERAPRDYGATDDVVRRRSTSSLDCQFKGDDHAKKRVTTGLSTMVGGLGASGAVDDGAVPQPEIRVWTKLNVSWAPVPDNLPHHESHP
jgi:hypothetical protein